MIIVILRLDRRLSAFAAIFAATGGGPGTATRYSTFTPTAPRSTNCRSATAPRSP